MPTPDWYPSRISDRVAWHANFASQAVATGVADGLAAGNVTQAGIDSTALAAIVNYDAEVDSFAQGFTEYMRLMLNAPANTPNPPIPGPPAALTLPVGAIANIGARTRLYAGMIKAAPGYTAEKGELYGIVAPAAVGPANPKVAATTPLVGHDVTLALDKGGFDVLVVESKRGDGTWEQIGVSQTSTFLDGRDPLVAGQPEQREYRVQGLVGNQPTGAASAVVSAVTVP